MRMREKAQLFVAVLVIVRPAPVEGQVHVHRPDSPYAGLEDREIKGLADEEIRGLLSGEGLGMALPAELNGYPGPRHVLELAEVLGLTEAQHERVGTIFDEMRARARKLGTRILELERTLDQSFVEGETTEERLTQILGEIAQVRGALRSVHLGAHLRIYPVLTDEQRERYRVARGYGGEAF